MLYSGDAMMLCDGFKWSIEYHNVFHKYMFVIVMRFYCLDKWN